VEPTVRNCEQVQFTIHSFKPTTKKESSTLPFKCVSTFHTN